MTIPANLLKAFDLDDAETLRERANQLAVSQDQLLVACSAVGTMPRALEYYLKSKSRALKTVTEADRARTEAAKRGRRPKRTIRSDVDS